jgi:DNA-binding response OmpR family regulator
VQSVCSFCSSTVGYSPHTYVLDIAEKLHRCSCSSEAAVRVFVVDDDESVAHLISESLRKAGFEVYTFNDGISAARFALESPPDVVVTDYGMPNINGLVLTAWLSTNYPSCKIVMMSGADAMVDEQAPMGLRFTLLKKPVHSEVLIEVVRSSKH